VVGMQSRFGKETMAMNTATRNIETCRVSVVMNTERNNLSERNQAIRKKQANGMQSRFGKETSKVNVVIGSERNKMPDCSHLKGKKQNAGMQS
jgi:hypothetical protein